MPVENSAVTTSHPVGHPDPPSAGELAATGAAPHRGSKRGPQRLAPRRQWRTRFSRWDLRYTPYGFISPFFIIFGVFGIWPLLYTAWISLHRWQLIEGEQSWVGLGNYRALFGDPYFWNSLGNTLVLFVLGTVPQIFIALGLAALLNRRLRASSLWRSSILLPHVVSLVAVTLVFAQLFGKNIGLVNGILTRVGLDRVDWQANHWPAMGAISVIIIWRYTGYTTLLYLAAMQGVPDELYEAAALDCASRLRVFWAITVPSIRPTIIFTVLTSTIGGLQIFTEPALFDSAGTGGTGGSDRQFQTLMMYLYEKAFRHFDAGYAAALAWVVFLLIIIISAVNFTVSRRIASKG